MCVCKQSYVCDVRMTRHVYWFVMLYLTEEEEEKVTVLVRLVWGGSHFILITLVKREDAEGTN